MTDLNRRLRDDRGMTLIELVIVSALSLVILFAAFSLFDNGTKTERGAEARHSALLAIRNTLERMDKDMRQATSIDPASNATTLNMCTYLSGSPRRIQYSISGGTLWRQLSSPAPATCSLADPFAAGDQGTPLLSRVQTPADPAVSFCYNPGYDPTTTPHWTCDTADPASQIRITIVSIPDVGSKQPITLATNVDLRNVSH